MAAESQTVVAGKNHDRIVGAAERANRLEDAPDLGVDVRNHSVIISCFRPDRLRQPGPRQKFFIANAQLAKIKQMLRQKIARDWQAEGIVLRAELRRRGARV